MVGFREVKQLPLSQLEVSGQQARIRGVEKDLEELVNNIRIHGQLEPIVVAPLDHDRYEVIAGQRRFLAMKKIESESILAAILTERVDPATARVLSVSENLVRRDLSPKDLIDACTELHRKYGSVRAVSEELGLPYSKVQAYVKYDRLRPLLKEIVTAGELDVKAAMRIEDHYGDRDVDDHKLREVARTITGMTRAQQKDYFNGRRQNGHALENGKANGVALASRPGAVRQILVTLREEELIRLRQWASAKGVGQDRAAAQIISAFFRAADRSNGS